MDRELELLKEQWLQSGAFADEQAYLRGLVELGGADLVFLDPDGTAPWRRIRSGDRICAARLPFRTNTNRDDLREKLARGEEDFELQWASLARNRNPMLHSARADRWPEAR